jgi:predicted nucleic acid-binding protein
VRAAKRLVLDANILLRGVLGTRVRELLETYEDAVDFYSPDVCFEDARHYITEIAGRRNLDAAEGARVLEGLARIVAVVDVGLYEEFEESARERIGDRDEDDWPVMAAALLLNAPIWTESGFFRDRRRHLDDGAGRAIPARRVMPGERGQNPPPH